MGEAIRRPIVKLVALASILLLAACGGDGSSDEEDTNADGIGSGITKDIYTFDTYRDSEVSTDSNGDSIIRTKFAILFKPLATKQQVDELFERISATVTASIAGARSVSVRIPDPGTVAELETIITDIENEAFVEAVMKSVISTPGVLPDNIEANITTNAINYIRHHAAVGGTAAWNARRAISGTPSIILMDFFGAGSAPLADFLDANLSGNVADSDPSPSDHGYHVAGIMVGDFGGPFTEGGVVTGMHPGTANLSIIDLENGISDHDADVLALMRAADFDGTVVMNTSLGLDCQSSTTTNTCRERVPAMRRGIKWADMVRSAGLEDKLFHATAAGNRDAPAPDKRDTQTQSSYSTAATMTNMITDEGILVPPLTNTVAIERLDQNGVPPKVRCLNDNSFVGGQLSAIGTDVISLVQTGMADSFSGTSMATPQVAGLAAYLLALDDSLTPQRIREILLDTARSVPVIAAADCSDWPSPAPAIDAYAAVLALDEASALSGNTANAPIRRAILDISTNGMLIDNDGNGQFDEFDVMYYLQEFDIGTQEKSQGTENVKHSRADLNGDGYDGGLGGYKKRFNLDIDYPPTYTTVTQSIEGEVREFDESSLSDDDILCYYAYSSLYSGSIAARRNLLGNRCKVPKVAIYYENTNEIIFPPALLDGCGNTNDDDFDRRGNFSTRPLYFPTTVPIPERPTAHFWQPGDSHVDQTEMDFVSTRREFDPAGAFNNCDYVETFHSNSNIDSTVQLSQTGDLVEVDFTVSATSECAETQPPVDPNDEWICSSAQSISNFSADYDFKISAGTNLDLIINMSCTGPGLRLPGSANATFGPEIGFYIIRLNPDGERIPMNRDPGKLIISPAVACYEDSPTVSIQQLIELDAPETPGDIDRVIIVAYGSIGAYGNWGNLVDPAPTLGELTNTSTMQGSVQLVPAN